MLNSLRTRVLQKQTLTWVWKYDLVIWWCLHCDRAVAAVAIITMCFSSALHLCLFTIGIPPSLRQRFGWFTFHLGTEVHKSLVSCLHNVAAAIQLGTSFFPRSLVQRGFPRIGKKWGDCVLSSLSSALFAPLVSCPSNQQVQYWFRSVAWLKWYQG